MKLRDFTIGWRLLVQEPAYSAVVILGLSVGFAACILLLSFVRYSFNYNAQVPDAKNVYVLKQQFNLDPRAPWFEIAPLGLYALARQDPAVLDATAIARVDTHVVRLENQMHREEFTVVLPHFAQMLGIKPIAGDVEAALQRSDGLVLTQSVALRWFGKVAAIGMSVLVDKHLLQVAAVIPDSPTNTTMPYQILVGSANHLMSEADRANLLNIEGMWSRILIRMKPDASTASITQILQNAVDNAPMAKGLGQEKRLQLGKRKIMEIRLTPIMESYFDRDVVGQPFSGQRGNRQTIFALAVAALLILALATINTINLSTVRVLRRRREIGMRKLLGASVPRIITQFIAESILVSTLATAVGLIIAWLLLPLFSELIDRKLESTFSLLNIAISIALGLLVGVLSSVHPAWIALRVSAAEALGGRTNAESPSGAGLRWSLTVAQFATAVALAGITLVITYQTDFASHADPGFDPTPLLVLDSHSTGEPAGRAFRDTLARLPGVSAVAASAEAVGRHSNMSIGNLSRAGRPRVEMQAKMVSPNFFDTYHLSPLAGRLFNAPLDAADKAPVIVLNIAAVHALGYASGQDAIGQILSESNARDGSSTPFTVVGIAPDIRHESLHEVPIPLVYFPSNELWVLSLRVEHGLPQVEQAVEALWRQTFPDEELSMHRADSFFAPNYADDARLAKLMAASTCIALLIAGFGIYVLSAYSVRRKEKEIVLRKLYGALPGDIARLILRDCFWVIALGTLIGLPFAFVAAQRYLADFVEHAPMALWTTVLAAMFAVLLVLLASARQILKAIRISPALALRSE